MVYFSSLYLVQGYAQAICSAGIFAQSSSVCLLRLANIAHPHSHHNMDTCAGPKTKKGFAPASVMFQPEGFFY